MALARAQRDSKSFVFATAMELDEPPRSPQGLIFSLRPATFFTHCLLAVSVFEIRARWWFTAGFSRCCYQGFAAVAHDRSWPAAEVPERIKDFCLWAYYGRKILTLSISQSDPGRRFSNIRCSVAMRGKAEILCNHTQRAPP
jgi:hypothetical protein